LSRVPLLVIVITEKGIADAAHQRSMGAARPSNRTWGSIPHWASQN